MVDRRSAMACNPLRGGSMAKLMTLALLCILAWPTFVAAEENYLLRFRHYEPRAKAELWSEVDIVVTPEVPFATRIVLAGKAFKFRGKLSRSDDGSFSLLYRHSASRAQEQGVVRTVGGGTRPTIDLGITGWESGSPRLKSQPEPKSPLMVSITLYEYDEEALFGDDNFKQALRDKAQLNDDVFLIPSSSAKHDARRTSASAR
jgi:hypothetical protein